MNKELFIELLGYCREMIAAAKDEDEKRYKKAVRPILKQDYFDILTFSYLIESDDFPISTDMTDEEIYNYFLVWMDGHSRGQFETAIYIKDFIYEIELPEKIQTQCINAAFMDKGLKYLVAEVKVLYGKLAYLAAFKDDSKLVEGLDFKMSGLEILCEWTGNRLKNILNDLEELGYIIVKKNKDDIKIFVKISDEYISNMKDYKYYFSDDADEPWVILCEWESKKSKNQKIKSFKKQYGFKPQIHILKMSEEIKDRVNEILN